MNTNPNLLPVRPNRTNALLTPRLCAAVLALLATACFAAPTDNDIKQALQLQFGNLGGQGPGSELLKVEVKSVSTIGCEKSGNAFVCDVEAEFYSRAGSTGKKAVRVRMVKGKDGWRAVMN